MEPAPTEFPAAETAGLASLLAEVARLRDVDKENARLRDVDKENARLRAEVAMLRAQVRTRVWREAIAAAWEETLAHHRSTLTRRCL